MFEYVGNAHMHTPYSDGAKWHAEIADEAISADLDFIIVTDHNIWVDGVEGYYENENGRVLLLVGEEVHDPRRQPQANHLLAYGAERELAVYAHDPQCLVDETAASGGFSFLAHPFDPAAPVDGGDSLAWLDWDIDGYTGIEIWNFMSEFKGRLGGRLRSLWVALRPENHIVSPNPATLAKWDELLAEGRRVAAIGNSDGHGLSYALGPLSRVIYPYEYLFQAVNTHILVPKELGSDFEQDKQSVLSAIGRGNCWVGYDLPYPTKGFRFSGQSGSRGVMGDMIRLDAGATLQVRAPKKCHIRLIHDGEPVAQVFDDISLTHMPVEPGSYRVECLLSYRGRERGWIYSNPVYLR